MLVFQLCNFFCSYCGYCSYNTKLILISPEMRGFGIHKSRILTSSGMPLIHGILTSAVNAEETLSSEIRAHQEHPFGPLFMVDPTRTSLISSESQSTAAPHPPSAAAVSCQDRDCDLIPCVLARLRWNTANCLDESTSVFLFVLSPSCFFSFSRGIHIFVAGHRAAYSHLRQTQSRTTRLKSTSRPWPPQASTRTRPRNLSRYARASALSKGTCARTKWSSHPSWPAFN